MLIYLKFNATAVVQSYELQVTYLILFSLFPVPFCVGKKIKKIVTQNSLTAKTGEKLLKHRAMLISS